MFEIAQIHSVSVSSLNAKFRWRNAFVIIAQRFHVLFFIRSHARSHVHDKSFFLATAQIDESKHCWPCFNWIAFLSNISVIWALYITFNPKYNRGNVCGFYQIMPMSGSFWDTQKSLDYITIKDKMSGQHAINFHLMTKTWCDIILNHPRCGCFCSILLVISWIWSYSDSTFFLRSHSEHWIIFSE